MISYVDVNILTTGIKKFIKHLKFFSTKQGTQWFLPPIIYNITAGDSKYKHDLFYLAPHYHHHFPSLDQLIVLDMTDLVFLSDIQLLQHQAALMGDKLIGMVASYKSSKQDFCFYFEYGIKSFQELLLICHPTIM